MAFDEKFDQVNKLISLGKEKGYLLYDEVNDLLPSDVHSAEDLSDLLSMFDNEGIEVVDSPRAKAAEGIALDKTDDIKSDEAGEDVELDLTPGALDKTNDPCCTGSHIEFCPPSHPRTTLAASPSSSPDLPSCC